MKIINQNEFIFFGLGDKITSQFWPLFIIGLSEIAKITSWTLIIFVKRRQKEKDGVNKLQ